MVAVVTHNLPDFYKQLRQMSDKVAKRAVRRSASSAGAVLRKHVRNQAPVKTGLLKRAVYLTSLRGAGPSVIGYRVKIRQGKKTRGPDAYYAHWVVFGHLATGRRKIRGGANSRKVQRERLIRDGVKKTGGNAFVDRGFVTGRGEALAEFNRRMTVEIAKIEAQS